MDEEIKIRFECALVCTTHASNALLTGIIKPIESTSAILPVIIPIIL